MENFFTCDSSHPAFNIFRSDPFSMMTHTIARENEVKMLTIPQLKMCIQVKWNAFKKILKKEAKDHYIESKYIIFFQIINDDAALLSKHKHQVFGMQFADRRFRCNNVVALLFRKSLSSKSNAV